MSTGADNKTMPISAEYADNYERIFGKDRKPQRGRFVWNGERFVPAEEYVPPPTALNAPIMVDRFYENTFAPDLEKTDIGSRKKHREYMKEHGLTTADDYKDTWKKAEAERARIRAGEPIRDPERRDQLGRIQYEMEKKRAKRR